MSHSTNSNVDFCDVWDLSFETKKGLYRHQSYDSKHKELLEKMFELRSSFTDFDDEASINCKPKAEGALPRSPQPKHIPKNMVKMYDPDEDEYYLIHKGASPLVPQTKECIFSGIKFTCKECHQEFRNQTALNIHRYSHNHKYLENTEYFDINSSQNMREFYITDKAGNYIEDLNDAINNSLDEIKNCYQFRKVKSFKYKITVECDYKKRTKEEVKITKIFFNTEYIINNAIYEYGDFKQWLDFEKELYEDSGYEFEFFGLVNIQINIEPTKLSIFSYIDLPLDLKNSKLILNIRNS